MRWHNGAAMLRTTPKSKAADRLAQTLGEDIIFGRIAPGTRLVEDPLMARFGATRHSVRRAIAELSRVGLAVSLPNRGAHVRVLAPVDVVQLYEVRELLHREAALRIPLPASAEFIENLATLHADYLRHASSGDFGAAHRANDEFHLALLSACGNSYLLGSIRHYMWLSLPVRAQRTAAAGHAQAAALDHAEMLRLLAGRDNEALAALCVSHLQAAKRDYMARGLTSAGAPAA